MFQTIFVGEEITLELHRFHTYSFRFSGGMIESAINFLLADYHIKLSS